MPLYGIRFDNTIPRYKRNLVYDNTLEQTQTPATTNTTSATTDTGGGGNNCNNT